MGTIKLEHLHIKKLDVKERVGSIRTAIFESMSNREHGVFRRVDLDLDDIWTLMEDSEKLQKENDYLNERVFGATWAQKEEGK